MRVFIERTISAARRSGGWVFFSIEKTYNFRRTLSLSEGFFFFTFYESRPNSLWLIYFRKPSGERRNGFLQNAISHFMLILHENAIEYD